MVAKMRKLIIKDYNVDGMDEQGTIITIPYNVRRSIDNVMLASGPMTSQQLSGSDLLRNARISQKITMCKEGFILLEESEYQIMRQSFESFKGYGRNEVELVRRVYEAEKVEVQEKKKKGRKVKD